MAIWSRLKAAAPGRTIRVDASHAAKAGTGPRRLSGPGALTARSSLRVPFQRGMIVLDSEAAEHWSLRSQHCRRALARTDLLLEPHVRVWLVRRELRLDIPADVAIIFKPSSRRGPVNSCDKPRVGR